MRSSTDAPRLSSDGVRLFQGFGLGAFAEQALIHENYLALIPKRLPFAQAALLGWSSHVIRERRKNALLASGFPRVYIFRPAYIYPVEPREEPNFTYRLLRAIYPAFRLFFPNRVIRADDLARAMVNLVVNARTEHESLVLENSDIRASVAA